MAGIFFTGTDPTHGNVNFVSQEDAQSQGLAFFQPSDNATVIGVDDTSAVPNGGNRNSVRISSKKSYNSGLFIADFGAMPVGCGVWPAWWSVGPNWPEAGEIDICVNLMAKASKLGLYPDSNTYRIMIRGTSRCGKMDEAFRLLHNSMEDGHKPFPSLYAPLLKALCKRGQFGEAYSLFNDMKDKGHSPNRPVYTMLIRLSCRGGRFLEAATFLAEMTELNLVPRVQNFDMVIGGLKNVGKYSLAEKIERLQLSAYGM